MSRLACIASLALVLLASVSAQTGYAAADSGAPRTLQTYRATKIIGSTLRDASGRRIGQIKELVLDSRRGDIAYAVVSFGGVLGVGKKLHAIPWQALQTANDGSYYVLHADRETINLAPGFDKAKWPDMTDPKWTGEVDRYWARTVGRDPERANSLPPGASGAASPKPDARTR
jgi:sporulation protein YlmC with PRC-barrel domain